MKHRHMNNNNSMRLDKSIQQLDLHKLYNSNTLLPSQSQQDDKENQPSEISSLLSSPQNSAYFENDNDTNGKKSALSNDIENQSMKEEQGDKEQMQKPVIKINKLEYEDETDLDEEGIDQDNDPNDNDHVETGGEMRSASNPLQIKDDIINRNHGYEDKHTRFRQKPVESISKRGNSATTSTINAATQQIQIQDKHKEGSSRQKVNKSFDNINPCFRAQEQEEGQIMSSEVRWLYKELDIMKKALKEAQSKVNSLNKDLSKINYEYNLINLQFKKSEHKCNELIEQHSENQAKINELIYINNQANIELQRIKQEGQVASAKYGESLAALKHNLSEIEKSIQTKNREILKTVKIMQINHMTLFKTIDGNSFNLSNKCSPIFEKLDNSVNIISQLVSFENFGDCVNNPIQFEDFEIIKSLQDTISNLENENKRLIEEKEDLRQQMTEEKAKVDEILPEYRESINKLRKITNMLRSKIKELEERHEIERNDMAYKLKSMEATEIKFSEENAYLKHNNDTLKDKIKDLEKMINFKDEKIYTLTDENMEISIRIRALEANLKNLNRMLEQKQDENKHYCSNNTGIMGQKAKIMPGRNSSSNNTNSAGGPVTKSHTLTINHEPYYVNPSLKAFPVEEDSRIASEFSGNKQYSQQQHEEEEENIDANESYCIGRQSTKNRFYRNDQDDKEKIVTGKDYKARDAMKAYGQKRDSLENFRKNSQGTTGESSTKHQGYLNDASNLHSELSENGSRYGEFGGIMAKRILDKNITISKWAPSNSCISMESDMSDLVKDTMYRSATDDSNVNGNNNNADIYFDNRRGSIRAKYKKRNEDDRRENDDDAYWIYKEEKNRKNDMNIDFGINDEQLSDNTLKNEISYLNHEIQEIERFLN